MSEQRAWWISWYHDPAFGEFELHSPWWISGYDMQDRSTIVAAVQAEDESAAWEVIYTAYDTRPANIQERFCEELDDEGTVNRTTPWTDSEGRFPRADWMVWERQ